MSARRNASPGRRDRGSAANDEAPILREPPHSIEAEQSVLGGLLLDNLAWDRAADLLTDSDFYRLEHRLIFSAIGALIGQSRPADVITVFEQLQSLGQAEDAGRLAYLNALAQSVPSAANLRQYAEIVRDHAIRRKLIAANDESTASAFNTKGRPVAEILNDADRQLREVRNGSQRSGLASSLIALAGAGAVASASASWLWDGYVPCGHVTLWSGHGGTGKSTAALVLGVAASIGQPCFGRGTRRSRVLYYSAEDPGDLVVGRLDRVCSSIGIQRSDLDGQLFIVDATDRDPILFAEQRAEGRTFGATTAEYERLRSFVAEREIDLVIVDNASDVYACDENERPMVRGFMRALAQLVRERRGALILLAHVDKATSRAGRGLATTEAYSGSTAWHNSARSRLFLMEQEPGLLELQHLKCNLGPKLPPLALAWPRDGLPTLADAAGQTMGTGLIGSMRDKADTRALLALIAEFYARGEFVSPKPNAPSNAANLLKNEKAYPRHRKSGEVFGLLRDAERAGLIVNDLYKTRERKDRERWVLTPKGREFLGAAPSAPTAPTGEVGAVEPVRAGAPAPSAPTGAPRGVWGESARAVGADLPGDAEAF